MGRRKRLVALLVTVSLAIAGLCLSLSSFLLLVVFAEGPITPRSYSPDEKAEKRFTGVLAGVGGLASFAGAAVALWWGCRRPNPPPASG